MNNRVKPLMMALILPAGAVAAVVLLALDAVSRGPYSIYFNQKCQRLADAAKLIGKSESDVVKSLGPPTFIYDDSRTYNYCPVPWFPASKFQVRCKNGLVESVEQFDD